MEWNKLVRCVLMFLLILSAAIGITQFAITDVVCLFRVWCCCGRSLQPRWLRSTVGGTPVFGRRTDPVLRSIFSWRVTTMWVNRPLKN